MNFTENTEIQSDLPSLRSSHIDLASQNTSFCFGKVVSIPLHSPFAHISRMTCTPVFRSLLYQWEKKKKKHNILLQDLSLRPGTPLQGLLGSSAGKESTLPCRRSWFHSRVRKVSWRRDKLPTPIVIGFPGGSDGKESAYNAGGLGSIPGLGRSPGGGHGNPHKYSYLESPHGQRSLAGYSPRSRKKLDATEWLSTAQSIKYA